MTDTFSDQFVERHFQEWLNTQDDELRDEIESGIRKLVANDPDYEISWPNLRRQVIGW